MRVHFLPVTPARRARAEGLHVRADQLGTVETAAECMAEADESPLWRPVVMEVDGTWAGFAMYGLWREAGRGGRVWLDRFFLDESCQGRGWAAPVLRALIARIRRAYHCQELFLSVYPDNYPAIALYEKAGFRPNGETDLKGERVMVLAWKGEGT